MIPAATTEAHGLAEPAFLARIRLRAQRLSLWLRARWSEGSKGTEVDFGIAHEDVERILTDPAEVARAERAFYEADPAARALSSALHDADLRTTADRTLAGLRLDFGLTDPEIDLLTLAVACEADPWFRRVIGYLHDDATAGQPTLWLASRLFQWPGRVPLGPGSALVRWRLAKPSAWGARPETQPDGGAGPWSAMAPWTADPWIAGLLLHPRGAGIDPVLGGAATFAPANPHPECLHPSLLGSMLAFAEALASAGPIEIEIVGPEGAGKRTLAAQLCARLGVPLLVVDAAELLAAGVPAPQAEDRVVRVIRAARLLGAAVFWHDAGAVDPRAWREPVTMGATHPTRWRAPAGRPALAIFGSSAPLARVRDASAARTSVRIPPLTRAMRERLWARLSDLPVPEVVQDWTLLPADIAGAASVAPAGPAAVREACGATSGLGVGHLVTPLARPYGWEDIVLAPPLRRHLEEVEAQARLRWQVYEDWGFERLCAMGRGISALFAGPSGTGKTMAAQVLGRALDMEVYRVDLAGVMSKYIGETEKNLRQVFDACERANVLLFFDEADALFGQRMQTKDAHDRFANIEIDYLLQRMEQYEGVAVLATNRKGEIDAAFLRRIRFIVDFTHPGPAERLSIWRRALLPRAPDGAELLGPIDFEALASRLDMTGADIKSAALGAAFLARAEGARIGMAHVLRAARRELAKHGVVLRPGDLEG